MYEEFFGLHARPFASVPDAEQYFPATAMENARQTLVRCLERAAGMGMVVGPAGTGKTLLCQLVARHFRGDFSAAVLCAGGLSTRRALLQAVLHELGQPYRGMDEGELRLALIDHLTASRDCPGALVLLVDEAHTLPLKLFEEIRMLTNVVCAGQARVRVAVVGGPVLEERLASPRLEAFSQRLAARCYLEPLTRTETQQYIRAQLRKAGASDHLISDDACTAAFQATGGVPRLINQVCDHALVLASGAGRRRVEAACIEDAWADLQQLPTPASSPACASSDSHVIEFGTLDDEPEEAETLPTAVPAEALAPAPAAQDEGGAEAGRVDPPPADEETACEASEASEEPLQRLDQIERALADVDAEFEPADAQGPEVELVFEQSCDDPFAEQFLEEELIEDRYALKARTAAEAAATRPAPWPPQVGPRDWPAPGAPPGRDRTVELNRAGSLQQGASWAPAPGSCEQPDADVPETLPLRGARAPAQDAQDDSMLVVEESYEDGRAAGARPVIPVRRQEYKQLFARLRRG